MFIMPPETFPTRLTLLAAVKVTLESAPEIALKLELFAVMLITQYEPHPEIFTLASLFPLFAFNVMF